MGDPRLYAPCRDFFERMQDNEEVRRDRILMDYVTRINYKINNPRSVMQARANSSVETDCVYFTRHCAIRGIGLDVLDQIGQEYNIPWFREYMQQPFAPSTGRNRGGRRKSRRTRRARKSRKSRRHH